VQDTRSVFCHTIEDKSEVWICYADEDADNILSANRALVYNWSQNAFTFIDLPNVRALASSDVLDTSGGWDANNLTWANSNEYWSTSSLNTTNKGVGVYAAGSENNKLYQMNNTHGAAGQPLNAFLEATKIDLDTVLGKANNAIKQLVGIMPQIEGQGAVSISIGVSDSPQGGVQWKTPVIYNIESDHKIDVRTSGRYFALRIESNHVEDFWRLTGLDIDVSEVAGR
jgi:hypothetical protein